MARERTRGFAVDAPVVISALALALVAAAIVFGWKRRAPKNAVDTGISP